MPQGTGIAEAKGACSNQYLLLLVNLPLFVILGLRDEILGAEPQKVGAVYTVLENVCKIFERLQFRKAID